MFIYNVKKNIIVKVIGFDHGKNGFDNSIMIFIF